jgi:uncharacterized glyoxalase superfamily protein PhnB
VLTGFALSEDGGPGRLQRAARRMNQFWGDYFGSLTDRFGINWMVNYSDPGARP